MEKRRRRPVKHLSGGEPFEQAPTSQQYDRLDGDVTAFSSL